MSLIQLSTIINNNLPSIKRQLTRPGDATEKVVTIFLSKHKFMLLRSLSSEMTPMVAEVLEGGAEQ